MLIHISILHFQLDSHKELKSYRTLDKKLHSISRELEKGAKRRGKREGKDAERSVWFLTITLCCPVRLGGSHSSWVSETVTAQGVSPMSTV